MQEWRNGVFSKKIGKLDILLSIALTDRKWVLGKRIGKMGDNPHIVAQ